jgi:hypothetical protein
MEISSKVLDMCCEMRSAKEAAMSAKYRYLKHVNLPSSDHVPIRLQVIATTITVFYQLVHAISMHRLNVHIRKLQRALASDKQK